MVPQSPFLKWTCQLIKLQFIKNALAAQVQLNEPPAGEYLRCNVHHSDVSVLKQGDN